MYRILFVFLVGFTLAAGEARAQKNPMEDQTELIKTLLQRLENLEKRLAELEGKPSSGVHPLEEKSDPSSAVAQLNGGQELDGPIAQVAVTQETVTLAADAYPALKIRGFANMDFSAADQSGSTSGFRLGQFILHFASPLSEKISYFGEVSFTAQPTGTTLSVERSFIRYDYNDNLKLSFGKFHTPVNYWNTAFHHGLWLQTTTSRPEMIQFGGRFLPVHFVGMMAEGDFPSGGLGLGYNVGVGNGRSRSISGGGDAGDANNSRAWLVNVFARPDRLNGLQVGGSVYSDKISPAVGPNFRELITSAHVVWAKEKPEFLAEFANVRHRNTSTGRVFNSQAFYVQVGYLLPWWEERWKPYYRFEYINAPASEPILGVPDLVGSVLGIRYEISDFAAFKGEYKNTRRLTGQPRINAFVVQTSFAF